MCVSNGQVAEHFVSVRFLASLKIQQMLEVLSWAGVLLYLIINRSPPLWQIRQEKPGWKTERERERAWLFKPPQWPDRAECAGNTWTNCSAQLSALVLPGHQLAVRDLLRPGQQARGGQWSSGVVCGTVWSHSVYCYAINTATSLLSYLYSLSLLHITLHTLPPHLISFFPHIFTNTTLNTSLPLPLNIKH